MISPARLLQRRGLPCTLVLAATLQAITLVALPGAQAQPFQTSQLLAAAANRVTLQGSQGRYTASVMVPVSAQKAWAVLSNYERMAGVMPDIQRAQVLSRSGRNLELAQTYRAPYTFGQSINARLRVQESPPNQMSYQLISGDRIKQLSGNWTITPVAGGVLVRHQIQIVPEVPGFLLGTYYELSEANLRQSMQIMAREMQRG